jgi:hypothetical protein
MADDDDNTAVNYPAPAPSDRFADVLALLAAVRNAKATEAALKRLRKLERDITSSEQKLAGLTAQAEQNEAAFAARAVELDKREAAIARREAEFETSCREAHDFLREFYDSIEQADRHLRYRVLNYANLLHGYNERLQTLPDWRQIKQMVPDLPPDPPAVERDVASPADVFSDPSADRHGLPFLGTLTRDVGAA